MPERGAISDQVIATLTEGIPQDGSEGTVLIGDAVKPEGGGWPGGQPGQSLFVPYVDVQTGPASRPRDQPDALRQGHTTWVMIYTLTCYGGARKQADWAADQVRAIAITMSKMVIQAGESWTIEIAKFDQLAPVVRNDQTDPPMFTVTDQLALTVTRSTR